MFLHVSVILFTGGSAPLHAGIHPQDQRQAPPSAVHAGRYGQQAGGTHPTGMQSCFLYVVYHTGITLLPVPLYV